MLESYDEFRKKNIENQKNNAKKNIEKEKKQIAKLNKQKTDLQIKKLKDKKIELQQTINGPGDHSGGNYYQ